MFLKKLKKISLSAVVVILGEKKSVKLYIWVWNSSDAVLKTSVIDYVTQNILYMSFAKKNLPFFW